METNLQQLKIPIEQLSVEQYPVVIGNAISSITEIDCKISNAISKANDAKKLADMASEKHSGWSLFGKDKREAIEALQEAIKQQANALFVSVDASKELFENQKKMSEALRYLFGLGVVSITANRTVVRELELKLQNASKEEISELAREEIYNVILQLRAQEDIQYKLGNHDKILSEHKGDIDIIRSGINSFEERCKEVLSKTEILQHDVKANEKEIAVKFEEEKFHIQERINLLSKTLHEDVSKLSDLLSVSIDDKVASAIQKNELRLSSLENHLLEIIDNQTFLDTKLFKAFVGIISFSALIISLLNL